MLSQGIFQMKKSSIKRSFKISFVLIVWLCITSGTAYAQYIEENPINKATADRMLEIGNYQEAVRIFSELLDEDKENLEYQFKLGKAYNYSNIDHAKGLKLLAKLNEHPDKPEGTLFELGVAYHKNYAFEEAHKVFDKLEASTEDPEEKKKYREWADMAYRARDMVADPVKVKLENLGKDINSEAPDYLPFVETDESSIFFTTRRDGVVGNLYSYQGYRTADIYVAKHRGNDYSRARSVGSPNTYGNEYTAGRAENGEYILYSVDSEDNYSDIYVSEKGRRSFMPPKELDSKEVNQKSSKETGAAITNDGKKIYFSSDREGGQGGFDIWVLRRLPTGAWAEPQNLGPPINTPGDELYPFLRGNESLLYFSSDGHPGMGGKDLFISQKDEISENWGKPKNMGYPINTPDDDLSICYASHSRYAYIGTKRDDSYGDLDIYRLVFNNISPEYTLLNGYVMNPDSSVIETDVLIEIFEAQSGVLYGSYLMNMKTGRYNAILPPGKYLIEIIDTYGYQNFSAEITLLSKNDFTPNKRVDIVLRKDSDEKAPELNTTIEPKKIE